MLERHARHLPLVAEFTNSSGRLARQRVRILGEFGYNRASIQSVRIAREIGAPENYLGKLLQTLAVDGLVQSQKGLNGGFRLARSPQAICLLDVIEPIDHVSRQPVCFLGRKECSEVAPCAIHNRWKVVRGAYLHLLTTTTIADLVAGGEVPVQRLPP